MLLKYRYARKKVSWNKTCPLLKLLLQNPYSRFLDITGHINLGKRFHFIHFNFLSTYAHDV